MAEPTALEKQELGAAIVKAIKGRHQWPIRLEIMDLKHEIVGFSPSHEEVFRISIPGSWV